MVEVCFVSHIDRENIGINYISIGIGVIQQHGLDEPAD
jgi:hypothetical protein